MESEFARRLRSGREYDHLFPRPGGKGHEIKRQASVGDTVHFIKEKAPKNIWQTKAIARLLKGKNLHDTCRNVWNFVYQHIQYQKDEEGIEQVRSPRRVWWERKGDCDCFTSFISSVLLSMEPPIPHSYRITKYDKPDPSEIRWQHIYPVVPRNGRLDRKLERREDYIVLDCVKDAFNSEQPYYEKQDFECEMKLEYLDGIEGEGMEGAEVEYAIPPNVDAMDLAALYDEEQLGKAGFLKKAVKKVGGAVKKAGKAVKKTVGKGLRFINRVANPATMLLRNGFLLAMKTNFLKLAEKLRYAYISEAEAVKRGMNINIFRKLKKVLEKAEKIYHGAGGKADKLKLAILKGKGNRDKKVSLAGLDGLDDLYADEQEYNIIHTNSVNGLGELGEPATAATIAAATAVLTALGAALKSVKGLFPKGSKEAKEFDGGESGGGGSSASEGEGNVIETVSSAIQNASASAASFLPDQVDTGSQEFTEPIIQESVNTTAAESQPQTRELRQIIPPKDTSVTTVNRQSTPVTAQTQTPTDTPAVEEEKKSLMKDPMGWMKENPGKTALGVLGIAGLVYVGVQAMSGKKKGGGLSGFDSPVRRKKRKTKRKKTTYRKSKIKAIKIL